MRDDYGFVQCPECGWNVGPGLAACPICHAAIVEAASPPTDEAPPEVEADSGPDLDAADVEPAPEPPFEAHDKPAPAPDDPGDELLVVEPTSVAVVEVEALPPPPPEIDDPEPEEAPAPLQAKATAMAKRLHLPSSSLDPVFDRLNIFTEQMNRWFGQQPPDDDSDEGS